MNTLGLSLIMKMGCVCSRETVNVNNTKYSIIDLLGQGGFSTVHLVENARTKKRYALKRTKCHSIEDERTAKQEIEYSKRLKHPQIIELIDSTLIGAADIVVNATSDAFLVLPYYRRGTLHDHLHRKAVHNERLEPAQVLRYVADVCAALRYMHEMRPEPLAHRDVKTANVCLTDSMDCVLMDLGSTAVARVSVCGTQDAQRLQDTAAERCSMPYRAPELFNVQSYCVVDQRTDVWSLGCLTYACCYYKSPFDSVYERGDSVALAAMSGNIQYPESGYYSQEMHDFISFMLKVNPADRPYIDAVIERLHTLRNSLEHVA